MGLLLLSAAHEQSKSFAVEELQTTNKDGRDWIDMLQGKRKWNPMKVDFDLEVVASLCMQYIHKDRLPPDVTATVKCLEDDKLLVDPWLRVAEENEFQGGPFEKYLAGS